MKRSSSSVISESWSRTETRLAEGRHRWTVDDFKRRAISSSEGEKLHSPRFDVAASNFERPYTFHLEMYPNGEKGRGSSDYIGVFLHSKTVADLLVKFELSLEQADGSNWGSLSIASHNFRKEEKSWGYYRAFSKAKVMEGAAQLLPDGRLTIVCTLGIFSGDRLMEGKGKRSRFDKIDEELPKLGDKLSVFFNDKTFSDVTVVCGGRSFACHKILLAASSDVLAAIFKHKNTTEARSRKVVIRDVEADVMEHLLRFVYADKCDLSSKNASGLLVAANKYNIVRLKCLCEEFISRNIDLENFGEVLVLSSVHEATQLRRAAVDFVLENMEGARESKGWKGLSETHPQIIVEMFMEQNRISRR